MKRTALFLFIAVFLVAACGPTHEERLAQLEQLEQWNRADSVMRYDSLALLLTDYFDSHGTSNERLRAHYILGRTYADLGESPAAISAYLDAAECADTTAADCDYHTLSRVYGQMASVYYAQNLIDDYINSLNYSEKYAWKANDTLQALGTRAYKVIGYDRLQQYEHVIPLFDEFYQQMVSIYGIGLASKYCILPVNGLLSTGQIEKAKMYLDIMEKESGFFNSDNEIETGRERYYYYKAMYYLKCEKNDSAEFYFRKLLVSSSDAISQSMASRGLSLTFKQMHQTDSAAKYAIYSYEMNDSAYHLMATKEVEQMTALHAYTRHQEIANREHIRADNERAQKEKLYIILFLVLAIAGIAWSIIVRKRRQAREQYQLKVRELAQLSRSLEDMQKQKAVFEALASEEIMQKSTELATIQQQNETLAHQINEANASLARLKQEVMRLQNDTSLTSQEANALIEASPAYQRLQSKAGGCAELTDSEWQAIEKLVKTTLPGFYSLITSRQYSIRQEGRKLCFLLRLHVGLKEASVLMGISQPNISKLSKNILSRVFGEEGSGKELIKRLEYIF